MAKRTKYEVAPTKGGGGWDVKRDGQKVSHHNKKAPAVKKATVEAKKEGNSQVRIKKTDGKIQEERTYGKDPYPPKG